MQYKDQTGRIIALNRIPDRIISLVPSQTELLFELGLGDKLVGRTQYCIHPKAAIKIPQVGGTKKQLLDRVLGLKPDLIIGNKEENTKSMVEAMAEHFPVWLSDVTNFDLALDLIVRIGQLTHTDQKAIDLVDGIKTTFKPLYQRFNGTYAYLIWEKPTMTVGPNTFINGLLSFLGFTNVIQKERYPQITIDELKHLNPDYLWLSSEPFPYSDDYLNHYKHHLPDTYVKLVDGEMFSWYGSRLLKSAKYFGQFKPDR